MQCLILSPWVSEFYSLLFRFFHLRSESDVISGKTYAVLGQGYRLDDLLQFDPIFY